MALDLDTMVRVRISTKDKKALEEAARAQHLSLAAWARMVLLKAAENIPLDKSTNRRGESDENITAYQRWKQMKSQ